MKAVGKLIALGTLEHHFILYKPVSAKWHLTRPLSIETFQEQV